MRHEMKLVVWLIALIFIVRIFLYGHFIIPSGSMKPTLLEGDMIIINRYEYGYSQYSLPLHNFIPFKLIKNRIGSSNKPKRGEVVVFTSPTDNRVDFIKRCVGLPGDRIEIRHGALYINGEACTYEKIEDFVEPCPKEIPENVKAQLPCDEKNNTWSYGQYIETFPNFEDNISNPFKHKRIRLFDTENFLFSYQGNNFEEYTVPDDHYFMLGDNLHNSADSRVFKGVAFENITAKAIFIFFSVEFSFDGSIYKPWTWYKIRIKPRSNRLGVPIV